MQPITFATLWISKHSPKYSKYVPCCSPAGRRSTMQASVRGGFDRCISISTNSCNMVSWRLVYVCIWLPLLNYLVVSKNVICWNLLVTFQPPNTRITKDLIDLRVILVYIPEGSIPLTKSMAKEVENEKDHSDAPRDRIWGRMHLLFTPIAPECYAIWCCRRLLVVMLPSPPLQRSQVADHITLALPTGFRYGGISLIRTA